MHAPNERRNQNREAQKRLSHRVYLFDFHSKQDEDSFIQNMLLLDRSLHDSTNRSWIPLKVFLHILFPKKTSISEPS